VKELTQSQKGVIYKLHPFLSNEEVANIVGTTTEILELFLQKNGMIKPKQNKHLTERKPISRYKPTDRNYHDLIKEFKQEQQLTHGRNHPFYKLQKNN
jgi:hypothetical protein